MTTYHCFLKQKLPQKPRGGKVFRQKRWFVMLAYYKSLSLASDNFNRCPGKVKILPQLIN